MRTGTPVGAQAILRLGLLVVLGLIVSACSSGTEADPALTESALSPIATQVAEPTDAATVTAEPEPSAPPATPTAVASAASPVAATPTACPAEGPDVEVGEAGLSGDVDGDGAPDAIGPGATPGVLVLRTASGATRSLDVAEGVLGSTRLAGVEDADGDGRDEVFVAVSREYGGFMRVASLVDCELVLVRNKESAPYEFLLFSAPEGPQPEPSSGSDVAGISPGMGCVDADGDGRTELVGTEGERDGDAVRWRRTIVRLDGERARNGATDSGSYQVGRDDRAIALLSMATCGPNLLDSEIDLG